MLVALVDADGTDNLDLNRMIKGRMVVKYEGKSMDGESLNKWLDGLGNKCSRGGERDRGEGDPPNRGSERRDGGAAEDGRRGRASVVPR